MWPRVVLAYHVADIWTTLVRERPHGDALVENASDDPAYDIRAADVALDDRVHLKFEPIPVLEPGQRAALSQAGGTSQSLTRSISRLVVRYTLAGAPLARAWPVRIAYSDHTGLRLQTCWEIRVLAMPLSLGAVSVRCDAHMAEAVSGLGVSGVSPAA